MSDILSPWVAPWSLAVVDGGHVAPSATQAKLLEALVDRLAPSILALGIAANPWTAAWIEASPPKYDFAGDQDLRSSPFVILTRRDWRPSGVELIDFRPAPNQPAMGQLLVIKARRSTCYVMFVWPAKPLGSSATDSGADALRQALRFRRVLDIAAGGPGRAQYVVVARSPLARRLDGTMYPRRLGALDREAARAGIAMRRLSPNHEPERPLSSDMERSGELTVFAARHLVLRQFRRDGRRAGIAVHRCSTGLGGVRLVYCEVLDTGARCR